MQKPANTTTESRKNDYTLLVVLDDVGEASGDVFLDDGLSIDIERLDMQYKYKLQTDRRTQRHTNRLHVQ